MGRARAWAWALGSGAAGAAGAGCGERAPTREFDCAAIAETYAVQCGPHLGISDDTSACAALDAAQGGELAAQVERAAAVCEEAAADLASLASCELVFVCVADPDGFTALTRRATVSGSADVEDESFTFEDQVGWAWIGTKSSGRAGDLAVLFTRGGRPWYFKLEDFAARARTVPFEVDEARPIKLENAIDNIELASGSVTVTAFALDGAFDIRASGRDEDSGDGFTLHITGSFAAGDGARDPQ